MRNCCVIMWIIWIVPTILYIYWRRGDWYLFIFPPIIITGIMIVLSFISNDLGIMFCVLLHLFLVGSYIKIKK